MDLAQAAIGPGMAVYTRYSKVLDAEGKPLTVRDALALINQTLDEALAEQEGDFDADSRWALAWFEQYRLCRGRVRRGRDALQGQEHQRGRLARSRSSCGQGRQGALLARDELPADWDPTARQAPHRVGGPQSPDPRARHEGESGAAALLRRVSAVGRDRPRTGYRLYTLCERKKRAAKRSRTTAWSRAGPEITAWPVEQVAETPRSKSYSYREGGE